MKLILALALCGSLLLVSACGGGDDGAKTPSEPAADARLTPPVDPDADGPLPARSNEVNAAGKASGKASAPCTLVSRDQAQSILGGPVAAPVEAPQGPTCIYRSKDGKRFVTLVVQSRSVRDLRSELARPKAVAVAGSKGFCGEKGRPTLYVPLSAQRVLSVAAPCATAKLFADRALRRLTD